MPRLKTSVLLFSDDKEISSSVQKAVSGIEGVRLNSEELSVSNLNGKAMDMATDNNIVIFATDPENAADLSAIETLNAKRSNDTVFLALTDSDIPLAKARALSDAGVDDVLPFPLPLDELTKQVDKWVKKRAASFASSGDRQGAIIPVIQARGGIGGTTVAVNLADHLVVRKSRFRKEAGNDVAIVDLDVQFGSVGDFLDVDSQDALMQMATGGVVPDAMWVEQSMAETDGGLKVLTAPSDFMPLDGINDHQISALIDALRRSHDYVVIDLPRAIVSWIAPIMSVADEVIVVTDTTVPSIRSAKRLIDFYTAENPTLKVNVVINYEKKPLVLHHHHKEAASVLEHKFEHWLPHDPKAARAAIDYGKPLSSVAPRSDLNKAITALAKSTMKAFPMVDRVTH